MEISSDSEDSSPERCFYRTLLKQKVSNRAKVSTSYKINERPIIKKANKFQIIKDSTLATEENRDMSDVSIKKMKSKSRKPANVKPFRTIYTQQKGREK